MTKLKSHHHRTFKALEGVQQIHSSVAILLQKERVDWLENNFSNIFLKILCLQ
jgi:hypothetical protein